MTCLLDTHAMLWAIMEPEKLSATAKSLVQDPQNRIVVSAVNFWEVSLKFGLGKIQLQGVSPEDLPEVCRSTGFYILPLDADTCASYHQLSAPHHRDPFDRILIWTAITQQMTLISKDTSMHLYRSAGLKAVW
jgi:PIN domain nuclease of toxin-antitoxin system